MAASIILTLKSYILFLTLLSINTHSLFSHFFGFVISIIKNVHRFNASSDSYTKPNANFIIAQIVQEALRFSRC